MKLLKYKLNIVKTNEDSSEAPRLPAIIIIIIKKEHTQTTGCPAINK